MTNRALHILTNKKGPFDFVRAAFDPHFIPKKLSAEQTKFHKALYLDTHECYAELLLCALKAFPDILSDVVDDYDPSFIPPTGVIVDGAEFLVEKNMLGRYTGSSAFPFNFTYDIILTSPTTARITAREAKEEISTTYRTAGADPEKVLHIDWPASLPFTGPMKLKQPHVTNAQIRIDVRPFAPPYQRLVDRVKGNTYLGEQLGRMGLLEEFHASEDPVEKAAIIAAVILNDY